MVSQIPARYVGDATCKSCHPREFASASQTYHAATLHKLDVERTGRAAPPVGRVKESDLEIRRRGARYFAAAVGRKEQMPITYALGSGKTGITYTVSVDDGRLIELNRSYFPSERKWYVTPGQQHSSPSDIGMLLSAVEGGQCLSCHASAVTNWNHVTEQLAGVRCEACHGPASRHLHAMRQERRPTNLGLERLSTLDTSGKIDVCGRCHRTSTMVPASQRSQTHRFQPYGLVESRCFKESGGGMTCITCHDPHADAAEGPAAYVRSCLSCHNGNAVAGRTRGRKCPVNPVSRCVTCHMPSRRVFVGTTLPTEMHDHRIAIYKANKQPKIVH